MVAPVARCHEGTAPNGTGIMPKAPGQPWRRSFSLGEQQVAAAAIKHRTSDPSWTSPRLRPAAEIGLWGYRRLGSTFCPPAPSRARRPMPARLMDSCMGVAGRATEDCADGLFYILSAQVRGVDRARLFRTWPNNCVGTKRVLVPATYTPPRGSTNSNFLFGTGWWAENGA